jgi:hypothetical protein
MPTDRPSAQHLNPEDAFGFMENTLTRSHGTLPGTEIGSNSAGKGRKGLNRRRLHLEGSLQLAETGDHDANR